jgi:hypothetical protein
MSTGTYTVEFFLSPEQELHLFAQHMEVWPNTNLEKMHIRAYKECVRSMLLEKGQSAITLPLPMAVEIKKADYRAALRGIVPALPAVTPEVLPERRRVARLR